MKLKNFIHNSLIAGLLICPLLFAGCTNSVGPNDKPNDNIKVVTDLTGTDVSMKKEINRIAIVPIPWTAIVYAVDGSDKKIVGIHPSAKKSYEASIFKTLAPDLENVNSSFVDNNFNVNFEEVAKLKPDVVIIWDYQPEVAKKLKELGIPAVSIKYGTLEDIQNGIRLLGKILDKPEQAEALISYHKDSEAYFKQKNASALPNKPKVLYLQNKNLTVAGNKSVNQLMITMTGGENAAKDTKGSWTKVSMEEIMTWDPDIIILSNFDSITPDDIYQDKLEGQNWSNIKAVKTHRVYKAPMGIYRWDAPNVETPLMMKWMGQLIQPDTFNDYILRDDLKQFYNTFYHYNLTDSEINTILNTSINNTPTF